MSNFREMTLEWMSEKFRTLKIRTYYILCIDLKHMIWRFRICNYFRDFMNTLRNFANSVFAHIFAKFKYFAKQFILTESPDHVL